MSRYHEPMKSNRTSDGQPRDSKRTPRAKSTTVARRKARALKTANRNAR